MHYVCRGLMVCAVFTSAVSAQVANSVANSVSKKAGSSATREGDWLVEEGGLTRVNIRTRELMLHAAPEPKPALKHRFIPDRFDRIPGNSALFYLKAMGYLEETRARSEVEKFRRTAREAAHDDDSDVPPDSWYSMPINDLPLAEAKQFMTLLNFQVGYLKEAALRKSFSLDRNIRNKRDPVSYLLPEIQTMRQLARMHRIRIRIAIRENRIADAIEMQGQQYALAAHLGTDEFVVSNLVGAAVAGMAWDESLSLSEHPDAPNLYWAFVSMPNPLIDMREAMAFERQFLFEQIKILREVDETPRPAGYWASMLDRIGEDLVPILHFELGLRQADDPKVANLQLVAAIAAAYPGAAQYLVEECALPPNSVKRLPKIQAVLLAMRQFYERSRDEQSKWNFLHFAQSDKSERRWQSEQGLSSKVAKLGWAARPVEAMLGATHGVRAAQQRIQQMLAMSATVEAIRLYAAEHEGQLPRTLDNLALPSPKDPLTGQPLAYELHGDSATLTGAQTPNVKYRLVLRMAK